MWTPPADEVVSGGWKPPEDEAIDSNSFQKKGSSVPLGFVASQVSQLAPWNKANQAYKQGIGNVAEFAGQHTSLPPKAIAAGLLPFAMAPELLSAYTSLKGLYNSPSPVVKGMVNTPQELSPQYTEQNAAIGISNRVPETAGKVQYENPYQYPSQLSKPKYVPIKQEGLPIVQPGAQTGDPHAIFAYNDQLSKDIPAVSKYQVFGDPNSPVFKGGQLTHGSQATMEELQNAGVPVVGRTPRSVGQWEPLDLPKQPPSFQAVQNPNAPSFSRLKPQIPAEELATNIPKKYPDDPGALINQITKRLSTHGENLTTQELNDYEQLIANKIGSGEIPRGTPMFAQASAARKLVNTTLNKIAEPILSNTKMSPGVIESRHGLDMAYGIAKTQQKIGKAILTGGGALALEEYVRRKLLH